MIRLNIYLLICILGVIISSSKGFSQQLPIYSQYMINDYLINPAIAGSNGNSAVSLIAREQWVGFSNSPKTHALSFESRLGSSVFSSRNSSIRKKRKRGKRNKKVGFGGYFFSDKNGLISKTGAQLTYSYHIRMPNAQLSLGVSGTGFQFKYDKDKAILDDNQYDETIDGSGNVTFIPDANIGAFYRRVNMYGGISIEQLMKGKVKLGNEKLPGLEVNRQVNLYGGYKYGVNNQLLLEPNVLIKYTQEQSLQADINLKAIYNDEFWGGLGYRTGNAIVIFAGYTYEGFNLGYAFDLNFNQIMKHTIGSHELVFTVNLGSKNSSFNWMNRY